MARSHPPTLLKTVVRTMREECCLPRGARILVAVSGGGDSMALLDTLAKRAASLGIEIVAHGVDHGLRSAAGDELDIAEAYATALGIPFARTQLHLSAGGNLQHRARIARFQALREAASTAGAAHIATAHHASDRAETVLMRLLRGAGPRGLSVLPARAEDLIRPMIRARKSQVVSHLERHRVPFSEDPSNIDKRFLRVRVRREVIPLLEQLSPQIVEHLNALADQLTHPLVDTLSQEIHLPVPLNRAQLDGIERAKRYRQRGARIRLPGGRELVVDASTGKFVLVE